MINQVRDAVAGTRKAPVKVVKFWTGLAGKIGSPDGDGVRCEPRQGLGNFGSDCCSLAIFP